MLRISYLANGVLRREHPHRLLRREADALAEGVDGVGETFGGDRRQRLVHHQVDIGVGAAFEFQRQGVGAEKGGAHQNRPLRSEEHTSELQSLMRISYAVFCLKKKNKKINIEDI